MSRSNILNRNLGLLKDKDSELYSRVLRLVPEIKLEHVRDELFTFRYKGQYVESRINPLRITEKIINNLNSKNTGRITGLIFLGTGLGYHINSLLEKSRFKAILIEKDPVIFAASLYFIKPEIFKKIETIFIESPVRVIVDSLWDSGVENYFIIKHPVSYRFNLDYYREVEDAILNVRRGMIASNTTSRVFLNLWQKNVLRNIERINENYLTTHELMHKFKGPVLLVASGPGVERDIDILKELNGKIPVISLLPSVSFLLSHGVTPDAVFTTDAGFWNRERLIRDCRIDMFTTLSVNPEIVKHWKGRIYLFSHGLEIEKRLNLINRLMLTVPMQGTSSVVLILMARMLGFGPIYLTGYDFSFNGLVKDHHRGAGFERYYILKSNRFNTWYSRAFFNLLTQKLIKIRDKTGEYTTNKLMLYSNWLKDWVSGDDLIRIGEDGIKLQSIVAAYKENASTSYREIVESNSSSFLELLSRDTIANLVKDVRKQISGERIF